MLAGLPQHVVLAIAIGYAGQHEQHVTEPVEIDQRRRIDVGLGIDQLDQLVAAQTVTIASLMEIAPPGTIDPTSGLYNNTMYLMAVLLFIGLIANASMKAVDSKHHMQE